MQSPGRATGSLNGGLRWLALCCLCFIALPSKANDPLSGEALFNDVITYANMGDHRTGGKGDKATTLWLTQALSQAGYDVAKQPFSLKQFFPEHVAVTVNAKTISAFPHWFPKPTHEAGFTAPLAAFHDSDLQGKIAYLQADKVGLWYKANISKLTVSAAQRGALGLIVAVPHPSKEIYARNAAEPWLQTPLPIPAVIVAQQDDAILSESMRSQKQATLVLHGETQTVSAENVIARRERGKRWLVISTPTSGWFASAGERGGGVALFLGLARWLSSTEINHSVMFVANSGHELSYMGAHHSKRLLPKTADVDLWIHLGASIGARKWADTASGHAPLSRVHDYNYLYAHPRWVEATQQAFTDVPNLTVLSTEKLPAANGELVEYIQEGYPALGIVGSHRFFHTPQDLPLVTSPQLLAPYGSAFKKLVREMILQENNIQSQ